MREPRRLETPRKIGRPSRGPGDPAERKLSVALTDLRDERVGLSLREHGVAGEVRDRMRDLGDPSAKAGNAEIVHEPGDRGKYEERRFDRVDEVALDNGRRHATSDRSARRTSSRASVTL